MAPPRDDTKVSLLAEDDVYVHGHGGGDVSARPATSLSPSRWWVLSVFCAFTFLQGGLWSVPGPISAAYGTIYGFSANDIQLLLNWGPIFFLPFALPFALLMDRPGGMRLAILVSHGLVLGGALLRVIAGVPSVDSGPLAVPLVHLSYILNAVAGPVGMGAVGKISELWFPVEWRGLATALMSEANILGAALVFLVGPAMVPDGTLAQLQQFNWLCFALTLVPAAAMAFHLPAAPPTPPSHSAFEGRERDAADGGFSVASFAAALRALGRNRSFLVLISAYGLSTGFFASWNTVLSTNLASYSPAVVGYLSFTSCIAGNIGGVVLGSLLDKAGPRTARTLLVSLIAAAGVFFAVFAAVVEWMPASSGATLPLLFLTGALGGFALNAAVPLFFELSVEEAHPQPEATVVTVLTCGNNLGCIIFLSIPIVQTGTLWMNWTFSCTVLASAAALWLFFVGRSDRFDDDKAWEKGRGVEKEKEKGLGVGVGADEKAEALVG